MIPKTIHYCWFGRNPLPELAQKCIASWKQYCPDYQIIEWNEDTFDLDAAPLYVREAYAAKKWAFVTDYVRLYAMTRQGGIYMDTDVEVVKPLDSFLKHQAFSGFENATQVPTGIMACEKGFPLFEQFLRYYDKAVFPKDPEQLKYETNVAVITRTLDEKGLQRNNTLQTIDGLTLYPNDIFCPKSVYDGKIYATENTCTIHHFDGSWLSESDMIQKEKCKQYFERHKASKLFRLRCKGLKAQEIDDKLAKMWYKRNRRRWKLQQLMYYPKTFIKKIFGGSFSAKLKKLLGR